MAQRALLVSMRSATSDVPITISAIVNVKDPNGNSIFAGKEAVAFTNAEEDQAGYKVPDVSRLSDRGKIDGR